MAFDQIENSFKQLCTEISMQELRFNVPPTAKVIWRRVSWDVNRMKQTPQKGKQLNLIITKYTEKYKPRKCIQLNNLSTIIQLTD